MQYFRFDTELQASDAQKQAYDDHIASLPTHKFIVPEDGGPNIQLPIDNSAYIEILTSWDSPVLQRTTNTDWVFRFLEASEYRGWDVVEIDNNLEWPSEEE
ncbi:hypothetical protein CL634_06955 [bacterium]|nr:hypothetical protein [bacterium]|tara:strand:- start:169 stop:471 length:303 start_codon:yes stop_codon:yes gene_type:complete